MTGTPIGLPEPDLSFYPFEFFRQKDCRVNNPMQTSDKRLLKPLCWAYAPENAEFVRFLPK
jgi:hypothetical protein